MKRNNLSLLAVLVGNAVLAGEPESTRGPYQPTIVPSHFTHVVDNPYFPLKPGTTSVFTEQDEGETVLRIITVTRETRIVMGVKCVVVRDVATEEGRVREESHDWFAQDKEGTVWYFGEAAKEFKSHGRIDTEGSWEAGVNGQPGIVMPAHPVPGSPFRQEYSPDVAEDMGQVIAAGESVTVPFGSFNGCIRTKNWSLLEMGTEKKWYAKGIGLVRSESPKGEVMSLVSVKRE